MTDARRAILAFALIAGVLILTPRYLRWLSPPPEVAPEQEELMAPPDQDLPSQIMEGAPAPERAVFVPPRTPSTVPEPRRPEELVHINTELYRATVSSRGGGSITFFELKAYEHGSGLGRVQLIPANGDGLNLELSYISLDGDSVHLDVPFELLSAPRQDTTYLTDGSLTLSYRYRFASGSQVSKRVTFHADGYTIPIEVEWRNPERELGITTFEIGWPNGLKSTEKVLREDETYSKAYIYQGGELADLGGARKGRAISQNMKGSTQWVALRNKYFTAAYIAGPDQPGNYASFGARPVPVAGSARGAETLTRHAMAMGYDARRPVSLTLYLGPLSYFIIRDLDVELERIMNFGFSLIRPISKLALYGLVTIHDYLPNYGVVLILFAIAIRIVTNPLTKRSAMSTQKMQLVQPRVKILQEKYKGNAQKLNKEMMALWKAEGVNPFGGCLPILIQLPLLWALFIVFRSTIELRGQPFVLWVTDLSAPDVVFTLPFSIPLYGSGVTILALIMGITMFVQQKLSGASANPQQKPMMYIMTGMFFLIFNTFPSGLNLYYAFSNILGIFQQRNIRNQLQAEQAAKPPPPTSKAPAKSRRKR